MKKYAYINGILIDGTKEMEPVKGKVILVEGETITDIVDKKNFKKKGYKVIDLKGKYILPGLINMHMHIALPDYAPSRESNLDIEALGPLLQAVSKPRLMRYILKKYEEVLIRKDLYSGVTTVRAVGGVRDVDGKVRDDINKGKAVGPRILTSNSAISVPGGHMAGLIATKTKDPKMAEKDMKKLLKTKPDLVKLMITGGVMDATVVGEPGVLRMSPEIVKTCCDIAHENGLQVAAHVESAEGVRVALENGVDTIEHGFTLDDYMLDLFKKTGAAHTCTISPAAPYAIMPREVSYASEEGHINGKIVYDGIIECAKQCLANDIPVSLGTDCGCAFVSHADMWRELRYFVKYVGASDREALYCATLGAAKILKMDDCFGSLEAGKCADMIVCKKNPLEDVQALRNVDMVVARGKLYDKVKVRRGKRIANALDELM